MNEKLARKMRPTENKRTTGGSQVRARMRGDCAREQKGGFGGGGVTLSVCNCTRSWVAAAFAWPGPQLQSMVARVHLFRSRNPRRTEPSVLAGHRLARPAGGGVRSSACPPGWRRCASVPLALRFEGRVVAFLQLPELDEEPTAAGEQALRLGRFVLEGGCRRRWHPAQSGTHLLVDAEADLHVLPLHLRCSLSLGSLGLPTVVGPLGAGLFARRTIFLEPDLAERKAVPWGASHQQSAPAVSESAEALSSPAQSAKT